VPDNSTFDLLTPDTVSVQSLKAIFDAAFMDTRLDEDGDLYVKEEVGCHLFLSKSRERIHLVSMFRANDESSTAEKLIFVNRFNDSVAVARAYMAENGGLRFDYYIPVAGGISKPAVVKATKFFLSTIKYGIDEHDSEDVIA
jgi:hypothetical protein